MRKATFIVILTFIVFFSSGCSMFKSEEAEKALTTLEKINYDVDPSHITEQTIDLTSNNMKLLTWQSEENVWSFKSSVEDKLSSIKEIIIILKNKVSDVNEWYCQTKSKDQLCYKVTYSDKKTTLLYYQYLEDDSASYTKLDVINNEDDTYTANIYCNLATLSEKHHTYKEFISLTNDKRYEYIHYINDLQNMTAYVSENRNGLWETVSINQTDDKYNVTTDVKGVDGYYYTYWTIDSKKSSYNEFEVKNMPNKRSLLNMYPINLNADGHIASKVIFLEYDIDLLDGVLGFTTTGFESYWNNNPESERAYTTYNILTKKEFLKHGFSDGTCAFAGAYIDKTKIMFECKQNGLDNAIKSIEAILNEHAINLRFTLNGDEISTMINKVPFLGNSLSLLGITDLTIFDNINSVRAKADKDLIILWDFIDMPRE